MPRNRLSAVFDLWFLWHETFLNSSSFLPLVVKHLFEYRAFRCGEYEYIPYAKKCQGYFSFFLDFFDFFCAALREPAGSCAAGSGTGILCVRWKILFGDDGGLVTLGLAQGLYKGKCQLLQIPNQVRDDGCQLLQIPGRNPE